MKRILHGPLWLVFAVVVCDHGNAAEDATAFFETKIRPVLVQHCYQCHSSQSDEIGGKLRVDSRDAMRTGGESGPSLQAGSPQNSLIIQALRYDDLEMPPDAPLPEAVIRDFERWVSLGAADPRDETTPPAESPELDAESLWSFFPRRTPTLPRVGEGSWPRDPIDHFVLSRIEDAGLSPTHDADAKTLVRRLYYDLIGLPPTLPQVNAFVARYEMDADLAVEQLVDQLLASPQYGIRWGRHWLDVARYGESNGDDGLGRNATFPHAWRYRDYVIDALNNDVPYDKFLKEQIAGDLLQSKSPAERNRQLIATGFLAIGSKPASAMNKNFAMDVVDDQINVVCTGVLGLSVACARCHDHKHDPIPTRDYYALAGIFSSTETLYGAAANQKLTAPPTPLHELRSDWTSEQTEPDRTTPPIFPSDYADAIQSLSPQLHVRLDSPPVGLIAEPSPSYSPDTFAAVKKTAFVGKLSKPTQSYSVSLWFRNTLKNDSRPITAYLFSRGKQRQSGLPGDHLGIGGKHDSARTGKLFVFNGNASKTSIAGNTKIPVGSWNHLVLVRNRDQVKLYLNGQLEIDAKIKSTFADNLEFCLANRSDNFAPLTGNVAEFALFPRALSNDEALLLHERSGQPRGVQQTPPFGFAMGVREGKKPVDCKIHINGQSNKLGPLSPRGTLTAYQTLGTDDEFNAARMKIESQQSGRLELAEWLTDPRHPQTARVMVNRIWQHLFGHGIVSTPDDFGVYGARPTHPDLLDHLANRFVQQGWSIKRLIRAIVLSRTYRLDSRCDDEHLQVDPGNQFFARHDRRRLDAESLRDSVLQVCGSIDYSPQRGSAIEQIDALINWPPGNATDLHRDSNHRSVYLCMLRHAPPKELAAFDLPDGVGITGKRDVTTLPTQSLFLLNSPFVIKQSERLASDVVSLDCNDNRERVQRIFTAVLHRPASGSEVEAALDLIQHLNDAGEDAATQPAAEKQIRTWASFCQALLMTNEFRYVD
ncbi:protein containing DUF1549 [Rhodopirellula maiorica SM1]|uniref:Protein containing DUF1549 n=1 Tax=Rhodopirellula maiorica SM1 TaxID=1265738 RepID=M5RD74_9BACT|nr:DUF1553 domain-containing protein [Rhodopirellula maiorica]EMI17320.1 protein containing DUF1549 [Rhodopirellula maiorica SM1]